MARLQVSPEIVLRCGALEARLSPSAGGRVTALRTMAAPAGPGTDWLVPLGDDVRSGGFESTAWPKAGCYPLVPFSNRIRAGRFAWNGRRVQLPLHPGEVHALHGAGHRVPWSIAAHDERSATMALHHAADAQGWPWAFAVTQQVTLDAQGLMLEMQVRNEGDEAMPCGTGFHPFIPSRFAHRIQFEASQVWPPDGEYLPSRPQSLQGADDHSTPRAMAS